MRLGIVGLVAILAVGVLAMTIAAEGEPVTKPVIGYLHFGSPGPFAYQIPPSRQGLNEGGYVEGTNVAIEYRWAEGSIDRLSALAADLVERRVDVIAALGPPSAHAAKNATSTIPIVFAIGTDPVAEGLVAGLARPGGNLTGISILAGDVTAKRLQLLAELLPKARVIALLVNPKEAHPWVREVQEGARRMKVHLEILQASTESEINAAFAALVQLRADALVIGDDVLFTSRRQQLVALASRNAIPAIDRWREFVASGGLISYGAERLDLYRKVGI